MGLFSRWRGGGGGGERRQVLDREAGPADLEHLRAFAKSREGVAFYVEPETTATDTTVVAVAFDGEWTRRRVGTPRAAQKLARSVKVACHDVQVTGYPPEMRAWNARAKADRAALEAMARAEADQKGDRER